MKPLNILIWHIHGSYLNALAAMDHNWYLPVKDDPAGGYGGRGETFDLHQRLHEVPAEEVANLDLDLVIFQSPANFEEDQYEILSAEQRKLPKIYLEHNSPRPHPTGSKHVVDDPDMLLVHVTYFNRLMWDNGRTPTKVIEHSVAIDRDVRYSGHLEKGITVVNGMQHRPRIAGHDIFLHVRDELGVPLDVAGMETEAFGGLGDIPYRHLHSRVAEYRFLFSPIRYTSLPLAVIEGLSIGMPVIALATTELPTVIESGKQGFVSCNVEELVGHMRRLLKNPEEARYLGENARHLAKERFNLQRFCQDWNDAFALVGAGRNRSQRVPEMPSRMSGQKETV